MGRKSRLKKERRRQAASGLSAKKEEEPFLVKIIRWGVVLALFTPLILSGRFYFPFVGPKGLYFMGICQIIFFSWLFLAINDKRYRPKLNLILVALSIFLAVLILSSIFGIDFSRSFWSKPERMTGVLMWLHLFAFFLVLTSVFQKAGDWEKIFKVSVFVAILVSSVAILELARVKGFQFSPKKGATLGNTSFLGSYLLFNAFLALWLFFQKSHWVWRISSLGALGLMVPAMALEGARAATLSFLGGIALLFLLWLAFWPSSPKLRIFAKFFLGLSAVTFIILLVFLFLPKSFVHQEFVALTSRARFVNWEVAQKGFLERPLLGWGPENYTIIFPKYFNPCFFTPECGREIWFDRAHNIVFDTLVTTGILGLLAYGGIFGSFFYVLWRKYLKEKNIDFWSFAIFTVLPISYFVQNLTVFDMPTTLMMFFLILGTGGFLANLGKEKRSQSPVARVQVTLRRQWVAGILILLFGFTFFQFTIQPLRTDALVIKALQAPNSQQRIALYRKTLETSPLGKYQIREFFAQNSQSLIQKNLKKIPKADIKKELDFLISQLHKTEEESPLEYRSILRLAHLYNLYALIDPSKLGEAERYGKKCIEMSPTNQQGYWALAQTKLYQRDFATALALAQKAIDLEPKWLQSHKIAVQIAKVSGNQQKAEELAKKAIEINPQWEKEFKDILEGKKD